MPHTLSAPNPVDHRAVSQRARRHRGDRRQRAGSGLEQLLDERQLGRYTDRRGRTREVLSSPGEAGSVLVLDRDRATHSDLRLVAHLAADEPIENAALLCASYLASAAREDAGCRPVTAEDFRGASREAQQPQDGEHYPAGGEEQPVDRCGYRYRLELFQAGMSIPELRWSRRRQPAEEAQPLSVRDAIAALERYEPVQALTVSVLSRYRSSGDVSTTVLRAELARIQRSPIVLNRRLREVVLELVDRDELSMSEIALRCGRIKRDRKGNESGETSWLARRLGVLPEGGHSTPTPWIHSDVLALIAREGLGVSPREVEL
jgi:hypothetical protein